MGYQSMVETKKMKKTIKCSHENEYPQSYFFDEENPWVVFMCPDCNNARIVYGNLIDPEE